MEKIYLTLQGGLGDCFITYFSLGRVQTEWGKLEGLRRKFPRAYIKAVLQVHNSAINDFLRYHPCLDEIQLVQYSFGVLSWAEILGAEKWKRAEEYEVTPQPCRLHLGPKDEEWFATTVGNEPYTVLHPFAGTPERKFTALDIAKLSGRIFVVGGSSFRVIGNNQTFVGEYLNAPVGITDLTGIANARLASLLISRAAAFYGTLSAYSWIAMAHGIPTSVYVANPGDSNDWYVSRALASGATVKNFAEFP